MSMDFEDDYSDDDNDGGLDDLIPDADKIERQEGGGGRSKKTVVIRIDYDLCEATGVCEQVCPEDVLLFRGGETRIAQPELCTECWICVENCVSGAIEIG